MLMFAWYLNGCRTDGHFVVVLYSVEMKAVHWLRSVILPSRLQGMCCEILLLGFVVGPRPVGIGAESQGPVFCASLAWRQLLLCCTEVLPLCRVFGYPVVVPCASVPEAVVHLSSVALGSCVLQGFYHSHHRNKHSPQCDKPTHICTPTNHTHVLILAETPPTRHPDLILRRWWNDNKTAFWFKVAVWCSKLPCTGELNHPAEKVRGSGLRSAVRSAEIGLN